MSHLIHKSPNLKIAGPTIEVFVLPSKSVLDFLKSQNKNIPKFKGIALIDTGASNTCINKPIADILKLHAHDKRKILTPSGESKEPKPIYDISIIIPLAQTIIFSLEATGADLEKQPYSVLLGRDILSQLTLIYHGWDNSFTLHY